VVRRYAYVNLYFSPAGEDPLSVADRLRRAAGVNFILGSHDLFFDWSDVDEYREKLTRIHVALRGTGATYRVESLEEGPEFVEPAPWPVIGKSQEEHPGYTDEA
jgi:hypothetical protein